MASIEIKKELLHSFPFFYAQRWYIDGRVECFTGNHIPLAAVAILVSISCILLPLFVMAVALKKIKVLLHNYMFNLTNCLFTCSNTG